MTAERDLSPALSIRELSFAYAAAHEKRGVSVELAPAIGALNLDVQQGEIVSILGASGCGKSTLLNLIAGLLTPQGGTIAFQQLDAAGANGSAKQKIGYIFQTDALFPWRTVEGNLMLANELSSNSIEEEARGRISQYLQTFHLDAQILRKYPAQLSGGMRQRVSIIQSLMFNPQLFLLDEPFSALDFFTKLSLECEFYELVKAQQKAAILVTHDIEEAVAMSDRVLLMKKGGELVKEFHIDFSGQRSPELVRGTPRFAELYQAIWSELKVVINA